MFVGTMFVFAMYAMYAEPLYRTTSLTVYAVVLVHAPRQRKLRLGHCKRASPVLQRVPAW